MKRFLFAAFAMTLTFGAAPPASAGPDLDRLSLCLLRSTAAPDQTVIVRWMFAAMAQHPDINDMASVTDRQLENANRRMASLFERLMADDCPKELRTAFHSEGEKAIEQAFNVLGEKAGVDLMQHPATSTETLQLMQYIDLGRIGRALQ